MDNEKLDKLRSTLLDNSNGNFLSFLKTVKKPSSRTDINSFISSFKTKGLVPPSAEEARNFFKKLEVLGVGKLQRYGSIYKFDWKKPYSMANMKEVAEGKEIIVEDTVPKSLAISEEEYLPIVRTSLEFISHEFMLRANLKIKIDLPIDLNSIEAERLQLFIKTLPF